MKKLTKPRPTTLKLQRETVRTLQAHELRDVEGAQVLRRPPITAASNADVCCA